jgi:7-keto-8-aminopelargonate synthetase-like enzyme
VISPATAPGRQLLRTSYMASHTTQQLEHVLDVFEMVGKKMELI